ncbi:MAG TPA: dockerin type I repeat-containing protein, partial [Dehalococcoidia bacterium]|nr:dockerin type I repeat-containing protein [Dehalococcoidia bacterium]
LHDSFVSCCSFQGASNNLIGGVPTSEGGGGAADMNIIAFNGIGYTCCDGNGGGIILHYYGTDFNAFRINSIFQNGNQPIDMANDGGLTQCPFPPVDNGNGGDGSNDDRDCPAITSVVYNAGPSSHTVNVAVNPGEYPLGSHVDVYKASTNTNGFTSPGVDPRTYLGTATITGAGVFNSTVVATGSVNVCGLAPGDILVAIATDTSGVGNSSEVSDPASNSEALVTSGTSTCVVGAGTATLTVHKDFSDGNTGPVSVSVSCTGGTPDSSPKNAFDNPDFPAVFTITLTSASATCSATEGAAPAGYVKNEAFCQNIVLTNGSSLQCTIFNNLVTPSGTASFTVHKDFSDNNPSFVTVSVSCSGGSAAPPSQSVSEANPGAFTITIPSSSATCSATEGAAPAGYTQNQATCQNIVMVPGGNYSCTILNNLIPPASATLTVHKDFSDNNTSSVTVTVNCTSATANGPFSATESSPATFTITGIGGGNTCTATEAVPSGYTANETACANIAVSAGGTYSCTITNTLNTAVFTVHKDFTDGNTSNVSITVTCTGGAAPAVSPLSAHDNPDTAAVFTINAVPAGGTTCSATEGAAPVGYTKNEAACTNVAIAVNASVSCTITNTAGHLQGDVDCDGLVTTQDAIKITLYIAGLPYSQQPGCPPIGTLFGSHLWGDVNCDGVVTVADAIAIVRYIGGLGYTQQPGCTPIGQALT